MITISPTKEHEITEPGESFRIAIIAQTGVINDDELNRRAQNNSGAAKMLAAIGLSTQDTTGFEYRIYNILRDGLKDDKAALMDFLKQHLPNQLNVNISRQPKPKVKYPFPLGNDAED